MDKGARYSVQEKIKRPISPRNQLSKLNVYFGGTFQTVMLQPDSQWSSAWTNSWKQEVYSIILKVAVAGHGQSGQQITSWLWNNVWRSLQGNPQGVCPGRQIFQGVQLCT